MTQINTDEVFNKLKKQHGEEFARVIRGDRDHNGNLCEVPNIVHILEFAGRNPDDAKMLRPIIDEIYNQHEESIYNTNKDPLTLLDKAGYKAWYVENEKQQNSIAGYFRSQQAVDKGMTGGHPRTNVGQHKKHGELLCTIYSNFDYGANRFDSHYIIHAVRKEVVGDDKLPESKWHIKPSNNPERQDPYGTSVISIQIPKVGGSISIKNRYNHTVDNPDSTFDNNPDNIVLGLTNSLQKHFDVKFNTAKKPMPSNFCIINDQFVRYNQEINNVYFGPNYYFSGSDITRLNKDFQVMLDCFILDKRTGTVYNPGNADDSCFPVLKDLFQGKKIEEKKSKSGQQLFADGTHIATVKDGELTYINLSNVTQMAPYFLNHNKKLESIDLSPKLTHLTAGFLGNNENLASIDLPNVTKIDFAVLMHNKNLASIDLPNVTKIDDMFLQHNENLASINLPKVTEIGDNFLECNTQLTSIDLPNATKIGEDFLEKNKQLSYINLSPDITEINKGFLRYNQNLTLIDLPNVTKIGDTFLEYNENLISINLPNVTEIGHDFLCSNKTLPSIDLPNVTKIGDCFLCNNNYITSIDLPNVTEIGSHFLQGNKIIRSVNIPKVTKIGHNFLVDNENLTSISLPKVKDIGMFFLQQNKKLTSVDLPNVTHISDNFLEQNEDLTFIGLPNVTGIGDFFLEHNKKLSTINLPKVENIGSFFLPHNKNLVSLDLPNIVHIGHYSLRNNKKLQSINAPKMDPNDPRFKRLEMICATNKLNFLVRPFYRIANKATKKFDY